MLLFLGSGVSFDSGLPSVEKITGQLLNSKYFRDENTPSIFYTEAQARGKNAVPVEPAQRLLELLQEIDANYLRNLGPYYSGSKYAYTGSIYRGVTSYEDLFHLSEQIRQSGVGLTDDARTGALVDLVEAKAGELLEGDTREQRLISLYHLSCLSSSFIEWMVAGTLDADHVEGMELVLELVKSDDVDRLDIVTLNHDTLVEQLLAENNISFVDGFGGADGDVRWFDDSTYDSNEAKVRIFKPHGSVNWYQFASSMYPATVVGANPQSCVDAQGKELKQYIRTPSFLSGVNKVLAYNKGIFSEIFYRFHQVLREHEVMVMSGYGWGDTAINFRLMNWLDRDANHTITLLYDEPDELRARSLLLDECYEAFVRSRRIIPFPKYLSKTRIGDLRAVGALGKPHSR